MKQVLAFSPQADQEPEPVKVSSIVKGVLKFLRASLPTTIEIQRRITVERDTVLADPTLIHQVLMNLCINAHQAMLEDGGVLQVSLTSADIGGAEYWDLKPGSYLRLTVAKKRLLVYGDGCFSIWGARSKSGRTASGR